MSQVFSFCWWVCRPHQSLIFAITLISVGVCGERSSGQPLRDPAQHSSRLNQFREQDNQDIPQPPPVQQGPLRHPAPPPPPPTQGPAAPPVPPGYSESYAEESHAATGGGNPEENGEAGDSDYLSDDEFEAAKEEAIVRKLQYGEASTSTARSFLRTQTPLLRPGQVQWDFGVQYSVFEFDFPTLSGGVLTEANVASRRVESVLGMRYGLTDRSQLFANMTFGWQQTDFFDGFTSINEDSGGIGDTTLGINYLLRPESGCRASIILSSDVTAPTGNAVNPLVVTDAGNGSGAWATSTRLLMVRSLDPVVLFWGAGYRHTFESTYTGTDINLGNQILYNLGMGFAANERVTLSAAYNGAFVTDLEINGADLNGSGFDLGSIRFAATVARCGKIYEPFIQFGVTERSPSSVFGFVITR